MCKKASFYTEHKKRLPVQCRKVFALLLVFDSVHPHRAYLCGKTVEIDESACVMMVVEVAGREGGDAFIV